MVWMTRRATSSSSISKPIPTHQCIRFSPVACMMRVLLITATTYCISRLRCIHQCTKTAAKGRLALQACQLSNLVPPGSHQETPPPRGKSPAADGELGAYGQQSVIRGLENCLSRCLGLPGFEQHNEEARTSDTVLHTHPPPALSLVCPMEIKRAAETCRTHGDVMPRHAMPCTLPESTQGMCQYRKRSTNPPSPPGSGGAGETRPRACVRAYL